jgi:hypothetical protein
MICQLTILASVQWFWQVFNDFHDVHQVFRICNVRKASMVLIACLIVISKTQNCMDMHTHLQRAQKQAGLQPVRPMHDMERAPLKLNA